MERGLPAVRQYLLLILAALALCLTACAPAARATVLIEYHRTGGIAGFDDRLVIMTDGTVQITRRTGTSTATIGGEDLNRLIAFFDQAGFARLDREYLPANNCCDLFDYVVTYRGHTVHTMDTAVPESLQPALRELDGLLSKYGNP